MILAKKIRLYPTAEQEYKLWQSVGTARFIYNWALNKKIIRTVANSLKIMI